MNERCWQLLFWCYYGSLCLFCCAAGCCRALSLRTPDRRDNTLGRAARPTIRKPLHQRKDRLDVEKEILRRQRRVAQGKRNNKNDGNDGYYYVVGSDDSGAGCLAGPVITVTCCIMANLLDESNGYVPLPEVQDCKRLTSEERCNIYQHVIQHPALYSWTWAMRTSEQIDAFHSVQLATLDCFRQSIEALVQCVEQLHHNNDDSQNVPSSTMPHGNCYISIVDGHRAPPRGISSSQSSYLDRQQQPAPQVTSRPWIGADSIVYTVALASILARCVRDEYMTQVGQNYPGYDLLQNAGYPTPQHIEALYRLGPTPIHRRSCRPVQQSLPQQPQRHSSSHAVATAFGIRTSSQRRRHVITTALVGTVSPSVLYPGPPSPLLAMMVNPQTGLLVPSVDEIEAAVPKDWSMIENPFRDDPKSLWSRLDSTPDGDFYKEPRFVEHIDPAAIQRLTEYVSNVAILGDNGTESVLDLCSSWTSHISQDARRQLKRVAGLGLNSQELKANPALTEWTVQNLNEQPRLPYNDASFDVVLCQLSIDYLTRPLEVCREIGRVLKADRGAAVHILFSNRLFINKAVAVWTGSDDVDRTFLVAGYLHFSNGGFINIKAKDLSSRKGRNGMIVGDPLYVVTAVKA